jgi:hypothetical protein
LITSGEFEVKIRFGGAKELIPVIVFPEIDILRFIVWPTSNELESVLIELNETELALTTPINITFSRGIAKNAPLFLKIPLLSIEVTSTVFQIFL